MKYPIVFLSVMLGLAGCGTKETSEDKIAETQPKTTVTLTHGRYGHLKQTTTFPATTVYQEKSAITSPIAGFIVKAFIRKGASIKAGQLLYEVESKERHAVGGTGNDGIIPIKAMRNGIILDVQQQVGNYVMEGTMLCTIAESKSLVFEINIPFEQRQQVKSGDKCTMELPDGTRLIATIESPLATMNTASQSECIIASARSPFLPEGLHVNAVFPTGNNTGSQSMILPKSAVQSDETLTQHWVMKLVGDNNVKKVSVEVVGHSSTEIEIMSDSLSPQDDIILSGGYGLNEGVKVTITKKEDAL